MYGNYGFWSWLRYWHIDSADFITAILIDKGYYDYDYERIERPKVHIKHEQSVERTQRMFDKFGFGKAVEVLGTNKPQEPKKRTEEELTRLQIELMGREQQK